MTDERIRAVIFVAAAIWAVMLVLQGVDVGTSYFKPLSSVVGVTILLVGLYDRRLWRWPWLRRLQKQPIVHGTWKGTVQTTWVDPATGATPAPIDIYMVVRQTASTVAFDMLTEESSSSTTSASLDAAESGAWVLSGSYLNRPKVLIQHRSRVHRGSAVLEVHSGPSTLMEGAYWTDRDTKGSLRFDDHDDATVTHYEHAVALFTRGSHARG